jgi:hypothetical protein
MTSYDSSGNVKTEVEDISTFTISATGTITDATFLRFLTKADEQVALDNPGFSQAQANEACALLICHQIARRLGKSGKTTETLGRGSYVMATKWQNSEFLTTWMDEYNALVARVGGGVGQLDSNGITRDDTVMVGLALDQSPAYDLDNESRTE